MFRLFACVALAVMLIAVPNAGAAPLVVDTFETPGTASTVINGSPANGSFPATSGTGILGTRVVSYNMVPAGNFGFGEGISVGGGSLILATQSSAVEVGLSYSSFGSIDVSSYTSLDLIFIPVFDLGVGSFDIEVTLTTGSGTLSTTLVPPSGIAPGGGVLSIPLASLLGTGDLSDVTGIDILLNDGGTPSPAADFTITQIEFANPIPEPTTLALWGAIGAAGLWYGRRRYLKGKSAVEA